MRNIAIIGYGKIAADQHAPSIAAGGDFRFVAASKRDASAVEGVETFADYKRMLRDAIFEAVAICTPPSVRYDIARDCLEAGKHVMLEKPPGVTLGEVEALEQLAKDKRVTLMTTWHAQANDAVVAAADALADDRIASMRITWHENVRKWHPGQAWIWEAGGFGVFDPGINALSIATRIVPAALIVRKAKLSVPENKAMPIAAELTLASPAADADIDVSFDFRKVDGEEWTIDVTTASGKTIALTEGGSRLSVDGVERPRDEGGEYPTLYAEFARLIAAGKGHVDVEPLRIVADAFMMAERVMVEPFED